MFACLCNRLLEVADEILREVSHRLKVVEFRFLDLRSLV